MLNTQFSPWPSFTEEEAEAVKKVLLSNRVNYWTGNEGRGFEKDFATFASSEYAIALANGTVALDIALKALNIGPGDEVIVTPRTFMASVSCVVNAGAIPVFADVDLNSQNIEADGISKCISKKTKAVIVVHLAGMPADMDPIMGLAKENKFYVIEDCAQAHGAKYKGRSVGSIGHIGAWSFCQDKIMTTGGEGGMVTTNDQSLWSKMWSYKDHGKSWDAVYGKEHAPGFRWVHESFGTNWRMTEMQATIGRLQLRKMKNWNETRRENARRLDKVASKHSIIRKIEVPTHFQHAEYKHYFFVDPSQIADGWSRDRIIEEIVKLGVPCSQGICPEVYLEKAFTNSNLQPQERLPNAKLLGETGFMMLVHPTLSNSDLEKSCDALDRALAKAAG